MEYGRVRSRVPLPPHLAAEPFSSADGYFYCHMRPVFLHFRRHETSPYIHHGYGFLLPMESVSHETVGRAVPAPPLLNREPSGIREEDSWIFDAQRAPELPSTSGLTEHRISKFFETRTASVASIIDEEEICVVCHDKLADGYATLTLDCGHNYDSECIKTWLLRENSCPICRAVALREEQ